jgi:hypothetical protein
MIALDMDDGQLLVGDGSVDRKGRIALKAKTGGWRAAPLIFGKPYIYIYISCPCMAILPDYINNLWHALL